MARPAPFLWLGLLAAPLAAACSSEPDAPPRVAEGDERIACALGGAEAFTDACAIERSSVGDALFLIVRHPDGGFRRFEVLRDGRGVASADGADTAETRLLDNLLEVKVGSDRYRFPATRKTP